MRRISSFSSSARVWFGDPRRSAAAATSSAQRRHGELHLGLGQPDSVGRDGGVYCDPLGVWAGYITQNTRSNDLFAWGGHGSGTTNSTANGLNQISAHGGTSTSHDSRGNMTNDALGKTFGYTSENLLTSASGSVTAAYDPAMRLYQVAGTATTRFGYDGVDAIAEYDGSNALQRRFVFGPGVDEPLVWYEGSGTTDRRWLHADERGSIVAVSNSAGTVTNVNTYDEYGKPGSANVGRFQYTGQKWIAELGLYDYKARMYHPGLGRFNQPDRIGYGDGMNMYGGMGGDPVNFTDPTGLAEGKSFGNPAQPVAPEGSALGIIIITGTRGCTDLFCQSYGSIEMPAPAPTPSYDFGGAFGVGEERSAPPQQPKQTPKSIAKNLQDCGGGKVKWTASGGSIVTVIGGGSVQGAFTTTGGGIGTFETDFWGFGLDFGAMVQVGWSPNVDTFTGFSVNFSGSLGVWGGTATRAQSNGKWSSSGNRALPAPGMPRVGGSLTESYTFVTSFICPKG